MNYYECIQTSVDYIENHIYEEIDLNQAADSAYMSLSNYYRLFFAIVGCSVKEYIRLRRIHLAAQDLNCDKDTILTLAVKYGFNSADSFSRAFKKATGFLPSTFKKQNRRYLFEKVEIMDKYFETDDLALLQQYPDIKVLRENEPFFAAAFRAESKSPEHDAFIGLKKWFDQNHVAEIMPNYRVYGYDIPTTVKEDGTYGYEVVVTIPDDYDVVGEGITKKHFEGGLYAVTPTTVGGIVGAWKRFMSWLDLSRYEMGSHQCLEEHDVDSGFINRDMNHPENIKINLYMPVTKRRETQYHERQVTPTRVAYYRASGKDSEQIAHKVWSTMLSWAQKNNLDSDQCKIYMFNHGFQRVEEFWHEIMITLPKNFAFEDKLVQEKIFDGGKYLTYSTKLNSLVANWQKISQYISANKIASGNHHWVEEWILENWQFPEKEIVIHYPLK
ncbi:effector binding domain-containing protein [Scatolibacter rhodanostii]|uniref:effector binding domain-containing protein n=1 Tax=Scatolibacter rhodanostii TaxID=2014781 RepID=UPI000C080867|nr:effector binding domain-containing protein [Scatolibacter rhodanostii]